MASCYYCSVQTEKGTATDEPEGLRLMMEGKQDSPMEIAASHPPQSKSFSSVFHLIFFSETGLNKQNTKHKNTVVSLPKINHYLILIVYFS